MDLCDPVPANVLSIVQTPIVIFVSKLFTFVTSWDISRLSNYILNTHDLLTVDVRCDSSTVLIPPPPPLPISTICSIKWFSRTWIKNDIGQGSIFCRMPLLVITLVLALLLGSVYEPPLQFSFCIYYPPWDVSGLRRSFLLFEHRDEWTYIYWFIYPLSICIV